MHIHKVSELCYYKLRNPRPSVEYKFQCSDEVNAVPSNRSRRRKIQTMRIVLFVVTCVIAMLSAWMTGRLIAMPDPELTALESGYIAVLFCTISPVVVLKQRRLLNIILLVDLGVIATLLAVISWVAASLPGPSYSTALLVIPAVTTSLLLLNRREAIATTLIQRYAVKE